MQNNDFESQNSEFCFLRYEFFKRSQSYRIVEEIQREAFTRKDAWHFNDLIEFARDKSDDAAKALNLDLEYGIYGNQGARVQCLRGNLIHLRTIDDPLRNYLGDKKEFSVTIDRSLPFEEFEKELDHIKETAKLFYSNPVNEPSIRLGLLNCMTDSIGRRRSGDQLPFSRWRDTLKVYDIWCNQKNKNKAAVSREMGWFSKEDRQHSTEEITKRLLEADKLILSAEKGTFPD